MKANNSSSAEDDESHERKMQKSSFNENDVLHELKHFLPAQAPLKDFIHHNTLHAFQNLKFDQAIYSASAILGYRVSLSLAEYRSMYESKRIREDILEKIISARKGAHATQEWKEKVLHKKYERPAPPRIGSLRANWKRHYQIDLDSMVHPLLFRILCSYLDQGISMWRFPIWNKGFLASIKEMERSSFTSFFKKKRAKKLLLENECKIEDLLKIVVGDDESLYKQYLYDQQFAHQGWSGMVSAVEDNPQTLLDQKMISIQEVITFELLLEIDALDVYIGEGWTPLSNKLSEKPLELFAEVAVTELDDVTTILQEAFEWSYYDEVLTGIIKNKPVNKDAPVKTFQAIFCIDDRECSFRRYLEKLDTTCETYGTPGYFSVEFFFKPEHGKFYTKLCPAPVTPKYLIKEVDAKEKREIDPHFTKHSHSLFRGWLITQTLGFWSALRLFINIFKPSMSPATASSFRHMDQYSKLSIENKHTEDKENGLQIGFTTEEMANRAESLLKSIGLIKDFAPLVYIIGHGSSSVNNPHYAAYDCGACSGRAGSVNSRVMCFMINHPKVREILSARGIQIPQSTQFVGGLHDTTRDEVMFFDEDVLTSENLKRHHKNEGVFSKALDDNSKERSRRFVSINTHLKAMKIHDKIK